VYRKLVFGCDLKETIPDMRNQDNWRNQFITKAARLRKLSCTKAFCWRSAKIILLRVGHVVVCVAVVVVVVVAVVVCCCGAA